ncbi:MAG TPA: virulence RhuM family protein [Candidatus Nanoarchaeia archaeon]|nr:virulence RhuM family protein [Candidatus Nanoarchaeia archaeon]
MKKERFLLYDLDKEKVSVEVFFKDENIWLTQKAMSDLFNVGIPAINKHLSNIFETGELIKNSVISKMEITANDGKKYLTNFYNLDAIISVGYRVNSQKATKFRIWATKKLKEYILKGFVLNDERLKNGEHFGKSYFDELIERIRDIRTSERNFYQKITDIYSTSVDYDINSPETISFFSAVQNKMHFGIHGKTAAEIIYERVDSNKENLGITCINPDKIKRKDIFIAKNYLNQKELKELNLITDMYLSFAELQAKNKKYMSMKDWIKKLDDFLRLNEKDILKNKGNISSSLAKQKASEEYEKFNFRRLKEYESDFDIETKKLLKDYSYEKV